MPALSPPASIRRAVGLGLILGGVMLASGAADAKEVRYVGFGGDDANSCTRLAPCRTLQHGLDMTPAGGEVQILTAGNYAPATIVRSVTVSAEGVAATVEGITINGAGAVVVLRNLAVHGLGRLFVIGIETIAAAAVHIERCEIWGFNYGILHNADGDLFINDTIVRNNAYLGVRANAASSRVVIDNSRVVFDRTELFNADITITRSLMTGVSLGRNGATGNIGTTISMHSSKGYLFSGGAFSVESSSAVFNSTGMHAERRATARISNATITENSEGIRNQATILTRHNNTISGNGTDLVGNPLKPIGGQ